jgi:hypothetical protein
LPDPERDKVYPNSLSSPECMILITQCIRSKLQYDRSEIEEVMSCQQIMEDYLYKSEKSKQVWISHCIYGYERTITRKKKNYDDDSSYYDVMIKCKNGEVDYAMCSIYARDHDLSCKPGGKQFKKTVQQKKKLFSMLNQVELLQSFTMVPSVLYVSFQSNHVISNIHLNLNDAAITVYGKKLSPGLMILNAIQKVIIIAGKHRRVTQWIQHDVGSYVSNV